MNKDLFSALCEQIDPAVFFKISHNQVAAKGGSSSYSEKTKASSVNEYDYTVSQTDK